MPRSCEPDRRFVICLESDKEIPIETRPVFLAKSQTMRQSIELSELSEAMKNAETVPELFDKAVELFMDKVTGWENITDPETKKPLEFNKENVLLVLNYREINEVLDSVMANRHVTPEEKKS